MKKIKQISYLSAIIIVIGTTIGAGIFFKNHELFRQAQGNLMLVISSWLVAGVGMIALALAIGEMVSASKTNAGTLEWFKNFLPKWVSKSSKNYVQLIFVPITLFTMPLYVVETWQEAGMHTNAYESIAIGFAVFAWIAVISLISLKASERFQWALTAIKFIPIIIVPLIALISPSVLGGTTMHHSLNDIDGGKKGLLSIAPAIVLIGGIPAISFAFDGFYEATSLKNNLIKPKKMGPIIAVGVAIILAIYIGMTIGFGIGSKDGTIDGITSLNKTWKSIFNVLIGIGILGIVNGYMMASIEQNVALYKENDAPILTGFNKLIKKMTKKEISSRLLSWVYIVLTTTLFFVIFGLIGIEGWHTNEYKALHSTAGPLYTFADVLVNYTSVMMFGLISLAIIGTMANRFTKKIKVETKKYFWPAAIVSSIIILGGVIFQLVVGIVDVTGFKGADVTDAIIKLSIFAGMIAISIIAGVLEMKLWKPKREQNKEIKTRI